MRFPTKTFVKSLRLNFSKRHGQNFLVDENIAAKIMALAEISPAEPVIEIGPGLGSLTSFLVQRSIPAMAFELDRRLYDILLPQIPRQSPVSLYNQDILRINFADYVRDAQPVIVLGSIPYSITTPLILKLLVQSAAISRAFFVVQREVAQRLCARPGTDGYGTTAVFAQAYLEIAVLMAIPPACFFPQPQVESALIRIVPRPARRWQDSGEIYFQQIVRTAFTQRRKTLHNSLKPYLAQKEIDPQACAERMSAAGISLMQRPETLSVQEFDNLAAAIRELCTGSAAHRVT